MDMLSDHQISDAHLTDWRKLAQGLHTRYAVADLAAGARLLAAVTDEVEDLGDHLRATVGDGYLDLKLISLDAVHRDRDGKDHRIEWVTRHDLDLARRISEVASEHGARADTTGIVNVELALDTAHEERLAPFWSALLTGGQEARGRGTIGNDVRDVGGRVPYLWFQETEEHEIPRQRFHLDVFVPAEHARQRIAAALEAGGVVVREEEGFTVLADADGNQACVNLP